MLAVVVVEPLEEQRRVTPQLCQISYSSVRIIFVKRTVIYRVLTEHITASVVQWYRMLLL